VKEVDRVGRHSKWPLVEARFAEIEIWLRGGMIEEKICQNLGIGVTTWEGYKNRYPQLRELLKKGNDAQVQEVEDSLFKSATGFYYHAEEVIKIKDKDGNETVQVVRVEKFKPPDTGAMCFFLKNKKRGDWADNPQLIDLRRQELEIRRDEAKFKQW
jgi:hypothetical protein